MLQGVWLPIIAPFRNDAVDYGSYQKLIEYYLSQGISGLIPLGTTGESPTVSEDEFEAIDQEHSALIQRTQPGAGEVLFEEARDDQFL